MATDAEKEELAEILGRAPLDISAAADALTATQLVEAQSILVEYRKVKNRYAELDSDGVKADPVKARALFRRRVGVILGLGDPVVGFIGTA